MFTGDAYGRLALFKYIQQSPDEGYFKNESHIFLNSNISHVIYSPRYQSLLVNSSDNKIKLFSFPGLELKRVFFHPQKITSIRSCLMPDGKVLVTGSEDGCLRMFCLQTGQLLEMPSIHGCNTMSVLSVAVSGDSKYLASTSADGILVLYKMSSVE
eukprot:TRINITY_DN3280_c0_g1_i4.p1 TRINITY_DN3280_c0_g1~~TRINITY_DN3280_c0_g1_i4.p1  ORF type:complete len:156 (-),score=32.82 TRINITY_DN3280_c0_g1_i4:22-489(-)